MRINQLCAIGFISAFVCLPACNKPSPVTPPAHESSNRLPTATEVFHLRSECGKLGAKILNDLSDGVTTQSSADQVSRYDPRTNRCYVLVTVIAHENINRFLYDGQTGEQLAFSIKGTNGQAKTESVRASSSLVPKYSTPDEFIDTVMQEDR